MAFVPHLTKHHIYCNVIYLMSKHDILMCCYLLQMSIILNDFFFFTKRCLYVHFFLEGYPHGNLHELWWIISFQESLLIFICWLHTDCQWRLAGSLPATLAPLLICSVWRLECCWNISIELLQRQANWTLARIMDQVQISNYPN